MKAKRSLRSIISTLKGDKADDNRAPLNIKVISSITLALSVVTIIMSYFNFTSRQFEMLAATIMLTVALICTLVLSLLTRDRKIIEIMYCAILSLLMLYFTLSGGNNGFAILWTLLFVPFTILIMGFMNGVVVSIFFEVFFIILFWTPLNSIVSAHYTQTFMLRFPMLYTAFNVLSFIAKYFFVTLGLSAHNALFANEEKNEYLSRVSQELRTPLDTVITNVSICLKEELSEEITDRLRKTLSSTSDMSDIINDVLEMAHIDSGVIEIKHEHMRLKPAIEECAQLFMMKIAGKEIAFINSISEDLPDVLIGDETRIQQVVKNLLSNAAKFTVKGNISLDVAVTNRSADECNVLFSVTDTGIGMSEDFLHKVFTPFEQEDSYLSRRYQGSGLGLPISYKLIDMMGGHLEVESQLGEGSRFSFAIPLEIAADGDPGSLLPGY